MMGAVICFDGPVDVHHGFLFLVQMDSDWGEDFGHDGQSNGLLGTALPGILSMVTGLHTGQVAVRVEWHADEPALDPAWEDVVEAPYDVPATDLILAGFDEHHEVHFPQAGAHRARFCATGMDAGHELDTTDEGEPAPDHYLLQIWPAEPAPDQVVKQTSRIAAYWHGEARGDG